MRLGGLGARLLERKLEKDYGRRLGSLAALGPLGARILKRKLEKDEGMHPKEKP